MSSAFEYVVRFVNDRGQICFGNLPELLSEASILGSEVQVLAGDPIQGFKRTKETTIVKTVLCPLESTPVFQCIGVNYTKHAREAKFNVPTQPVVFTKPADSIAGPFDDVYCHPDARSQLDYEGELCFVFGKDCKNATEDTALDYVLGYTVGNDISARNYIPPEISGFQMSYGKSFDAFAPFGPYIVSPTIVKDPHSLQLVTKVNGKVRQNENTSDMIWNIKEIIVHLSRGRTVKAGTVCMTGTPSGVGWLMNPTGYVKDGDIMEVSIDKLGSIRNKVVFGVK